MRIILSLSLMFLLNACSEKPQFLGSKKVAEPSYKGAKTQVVEPGWTPGDKTSWEAQLKARAQGQNEYSRVE